MPLIYVEVLLDMSVLDLGEVVYAAVELEFIPGLFQRPYKKNRLAFTTFPSLGTPFTSRLR